MPSHSLVFLSFYFSILLILVHSHYLVPSNKNVCFLLHIKFKQFIAFLPPCDSLALYQHLSTLFFHSLLFHPFLSFFVIPSFSSFFVIPSFSFILCYSTLFFHSLLFHPFLSFFVIPPFSFILCYSTLFFHSLLFHPFLSIFVIPPFSFILCYSTLFFHSLLFHPFLSFFVIPPFSFILCYSTLFFHSLLFHPFLSFFVIPPFSFVESYLIGETNCSSTTSNYSLAYQKSFNRTPKGKQPICSCHPSFTGRYKILAYAKPNKQLFILSSVNPRPQAYKGRYRPTRDVYFNADLRPFRENRNRAPCHT